MAKSKRIEYKNYQEYLDSPEWAKLRKANHNRVKREYDLVEVECEACCNIESDIEMNVHHFIYPKNWNDDKIEYHVVLCKDCHNKIHDETTSDIIKDYIGEPSTRKQFLRLFNSYLFNESDEQMINEHHDKKRCIEIIKKCLISDKIQFSSKLIKSMYGGYYWSNDIMGVKLTPWVESELMDCLPLDKDLD